MPDYEARMGTRRSAKEQFSVDRYTINIMKLVNYPRWKSIAPVHTRAKQTECRLGSQTDGRPPSLGSDEDVMMV